MLITKINTCSSRIYNEANVVSSNRSRQMEEISSLRSHNKPYTTISIISTRIRRRRSGRTTIIVHLERFHIFRNRQCCSYLCFWILRWIRQIHIITTNSIPLKLNFICFLCIGSPGRGCCHAHCKQGRKAQKLVFEFHCIFPSILKRHTPL